ncbi:hypothetical protein X928_07325 [Petrotoga miotherma DSM 10691]|uniref:Epoxyqueuosine reductase QueH n=1 Tax=Petrotoga miotherma DSM 10691 TaxID=1434326 RepID=A0A2K1P9C5_9BACT|nr:epoxyqueuosine reductase QueH [Petrotoga miotherma]MDN5345613.1 epoxyqueuosine reductase [Petrotoga sp.]PNR99393.1 hypothetical protein X928_07325 [Petrotoga miotherma DSM 10691]
MKIFLHVCCAPDLTVSYRKLAEQGFEPVVFFYNPNIYPLQEYSKRLDEVKKLRDIWGFQLYEGDYEPDKFLERIKGKENSLTANKEDSPKRCYECMKLRLEKTKAKAKRLNFSIYSTTLLASPRKSHKDILEITKNLDKEENPSFKYVNFRSNNGVHMAAQICKTYNIYRQNYCGCSFSLNESKRYEEESKQKNYKSLVEILGEELTQKYFTFYKKDLLRIPQDIPAKFLEKVGLHFLKYLKPQIILIKKEIAQDFNIVTSSRYKIDNWKGKVILW